MSERAFPSVLFYERYSKEEVAQYFTDIFFTRELLLHTPAVQKKVVELARKDADEESDETDIQLTIFSLEEKEFGHYVEYFNAIKSQDLVKRTYIKNPQTSASLLLLERKNCTYMLALTQKDQTFIFDTAVSMRIPKDTQSSSRTILRSVLTGK